MNSLPTGWEEAPIGSLFELHNGRAFKPSEWRNEGVPIVRIQNLNNPDAKFNYFDGEIDDRHRLYGGELLFAWSGTPGTSFGAHEWRGGEAVLNQHIFRVDFDERLLDKTYLTFAINQKLDELINKAHGGVGLRHVTKRIFEATRIRVPPLEEQKRIAKTLTRVLARIDACRSRLSRVPVILRRFRQAAILAATSGGLLERETEWESVTLGALLQEKPRNGFSPRAVDYETAVKSLSLRATTTGRFLPEYFKYIDADIPPSSHLWLRPGDILIQRANALEYVGVSAIFDGPPNTYIYPDLMMKCRANERVLTKYLHYLLLSEPVRRYFRQHATGTAGSMPKINQQTVTNVPIMLPSLAEQERIVAKLEELFAGADALEARHALATTATARLGPALIQKAFRGELVPQDLDAEPARQLLERIRVSREERIRTAKPRRPSPVAESVELLRTVAETLKEAGDWIAADDAFRRCGLFEEGATDRVEELYAELRELDIAGRLETQAVRDKQGRKLYDRLRLKVGG
jgi:type I restriction enzyme, S subunit